MTVSDDAVRAAFIALYDRPHVEGVSQADIRRALEAAALHMSRTITTAEDLDALPNGSVVLSETYRHYLNAQRISFQRWEDGDWHRGGRSASTHPDNFLPATVLHEASRG